MKSILQKVLCVLATISIIVFAVYKLGYYLRPTSTDFCIDEINTFHSMPCDSIEVIGYGSSHEWHAINPEVLYDEYGIGAYNYGCNWQKINTSLLFLEDSFRTQKPKVVLTSTEQEWNKNWKFSLFHFYYCERLNIFAQVNQ